MAPGITGVAKQTHKQKEQLEEPTNDQLPLEMLFSKKTISRNQGLNAVKCVIKLLGVWDITTPARKK